MLAGDWDPSLRSGFRQRARTPAKRLNLPLVDGPVKPSYSSPATEILRFTQDFGKRAQMPAKRPNLPLVDGPVKPSHSSLATEILRFTQDFGSGLGRPLNASTYH